MAASPPLSIEQAIRDLVAEEITRVVAPLRAEIEQIRAPASASRSARSSAGRRAAPRL